jgi:hypothetical protein
VLIHLQLPMRMAGGLEGALGLGLVVGVVPDQEGTEDGELAVVAEQATAAADTTSNPNASIKPNAPNQKTSHLPTATLQRVYSQPPPAPTPHCDNNFEHEREREVYTSTMDELRAIESGDERVVMLDWRMGKWRMEDIVRDWNRERGSREDDL